MERLQVTCHERFLSRDLTTSLIFLADAKSITTAARVVSYYVDEVTFTFTIWAVRLSILWTIIQITTKPRHRIRLYYVAALFMFFAIILVAQKFWVCIPQKEWTQVPGELCPVGEQIAIAEIISGYQISILYRELLNSSFHFL
jgi:hypothetical protein